MCAWCSYESTHSSGMRRLSKELGMTLVSSALLVCSQLNSTLN